MTKTPTLLRQFFAEFLGTFFLVFIGDGSIAQHLFKEEQTFMPIAFGYGLGLMIGILVSGGVSGGHLNPAVTFSMACMRKCKWVQLPVYWAGQYLGAFVAAAILFGLYADGILSVGKENALGIFASYPGVFGDGSIPSVATLISDQVFGTAILLIIIMAVTDKRNMKVPSSLVPLLIGLGLTVSALFN